MKRNGVMLDTDHCIAIINEKGFFGWTRVESYARRGGLFVSVIAVWELWYGVYNGQNQKREKNENRLRSFLRGVQVLRFDQNAAQHAAMIRKELQRCVIGEGDTLIGGHARSQEMTLASRNRKHLGRIRGLNTVDWVST